MQKRPTNNYFNFTRKERNGIILLLLFIFFLTAIQYIYPLIFTEKKIYTDIAKMELPELKAKQQNNTNKYDRKKYDDYDDHTEFRSPENKFIDNPVKVELFYFDPNTLSASGWRKLGIKDKTINTIQNFIAKGGKFRLPEDIKKIWGLHEDQVQRLLPYVKIISSNVVPETKGYLPVEKKYESKKSFELIDINLADSNSWIRLPGIGSRLSNRIIQFREKLGGFYSVDQVAETFGLPDSVFNKIKPMLLLQEKKLRLININTVSLDELKQHPYIRYNLANLVVQYRTQHGNFSDISDIKKIMLINDELYHKLSPYLTLQ